MHILNYMYSQISCRHLLTLMVFNELQTIMILNGAIIVFFFWYFLKLDRPWTYYAEKITTDEF